MGVGMAVGLLARGGLGLGGRWCIVDAGFVPGGEGWCAFLFLWFFW